MYSGYSVSLALHLPVRRSELCRHHDGLGKEELGCYKIHSNEMFLELNKVCGAVGCTDMQAHNNFESPAPRDQGAQPLFLKKRF
jgi:hypothetical protein